MLTLHIDKLFSTSFMSNINSYIHQICPQKNRPFEDKNHRENQQNYVEAKDGEIKKGLSGKGI